MVFEYGDIHEPPADFVRPEQWPEYDILTDPPPICKRERIIDGIRWSLWPLCFEQYYSDQEPNIEKNFAGELAYNRAIMWKRTRDTKVVPADWHSFSKQPSQIDGYIDISSVHNITDTWHSKIKKQFSWWQREASHQYVIEEIPFEIYNCAYNKSTVFARTGAYRTIQLQDKYNNDTSRKNIVLLGLREITTREIIAGTAVIFSSQYQSSTHFAPFILPRARSKNAAMILMHAWLQETKKRGYRYAISTNFWFPSKPKDWRGFSQFKSHFGFSYVSYPPVLYRFVRGKLW